MHILSECVCVYAHTHRQEEKHVHIDTTHSQAKWGNILQYTHRETVREACTRYSKATLGNTL